MNVSGVSMVDSLAQSFTEMSVSRIQQQIAVSVMKEIQDSQQEQAAAILKMMQQPSPSLTGTGQLIDRFA